MNPTIVCSLVNIEGVDTCSCLYTVDPIETNIKIPVSLDNELYFKKVNWTVSYDPKSKIWISFHDWVPSLMIPSFNHFISIKDKALWRHNVRTDSYAKYYGDDYPWEVEYPIVTPNNVNTLRSVEYYLETQKYYNNGKDFYHVLDNNFDRVMIYNSEQNSGLLKLNLQARNNPVAILDYPIVDEFAGNISVLYSKTENKFRFNQFYDITGNRTATVPMWNTEANGYKKVINPGYVDYAKTPTEHKKFRHYGNKIILRKNISGDNKMLLKLVNTKILNSPR